MTNKELKKIKEHKMFNRTDSNIKALIECLNEKLKSYKHKMSLICTELNKTKGEINTLEKIMAYRQENDIHIIDPFYYK